MDKKPFIIGVKRVKFNDVIGYSVFVAEPTEGTIGFETNKLWLTDDKFDFLVQGIGGMQNVEKLVNCPVLIVYDKRGKATSVMVSKG